MGILSSRGSLIEISTVLALGAQTRKLQRLRSSIFAPSFSLASAVTMFLSQAYSDVWQNSVYLVMRLIPRKAQSHPATKGHEKCKRLCSQPVHTIRESRQV